MKKMIALLLVVALASVTVGCGGASSTPPKSTTAPSTAGTGK
jgi:ABC-type glycerol-3-phosphate transport system substrate-binding protein